MCVRLGLVVRRDAVGDGVRLGSRVRAAFVVDAITDVGETSGALVGLERFVDEEVPQALAVMRAITAIAAPSARRDDRALGEREARVTRPR